ncbi:hypothetical protein IEO21_10692 [Rhodonia placenta]|uniref:Uncharacterized protein n=1 Tax=Rhodonia placenta TaxID=104341 RepID=A0A8H7NS10_9APHY|nr:hypothetical protein IEO21_10692 [Postia placenta]
MGRNELKSSGA